MTLGIFALALEGGSVGIGVDRVPHMTWFEGWLDRLCQCLGNEGVADLFRTQICRGRRQNQTGMTLTTLLGQAHT